MISPGPQSADNVISELARLVDRYTLASHLTWALWAVIQANTSEIEVGLCHLFLHSTLPGLSLLKGQPFVVVVVVVAVASFTRKRWWPCDYGSATQERVVVVVIVAIVVVVVVAHVFVLPWCWLIVLAVICLEPSLQVGCPCCPTVCLLLSRNSTAGSFTFSFMRTTEHSRNSSSLGPTNSGLIR